MAGSGKHRKHARRLPKVAGEARPFRESPYSYEGAIEAIGVFGRGTRGMSRAQARIVRRLFALTVAVLVVLYIVSWLVSR